MMARLMIDSAVLWARDYRIDSFRFDIMGHQPRSGDGAAQGGLNAATRAPGAAARRGLELRRGGRRRRFVQASQVAERLGHRHFSHFARDAVRGGGGC
jgi:pullulanase